MDCAENKKALENFLLDIECLNSLDNWTGSFNIFEVLGISHTEIRHSNMLAWLLNPAENHGLGDSVLRNFIQDIVKNKIYGSNVNPLELMTENLNSAQVIREWEHIDLICSTNRFVIVIENKIYSGEHDDQLNRYREIIEKKREYRDKKKIYLYLTPEGLPSSDEENWQSISYSEILNSIKKAFNPKKNEISDGVRCLIGDYINILRSKIVLDPELIEICKKIYKDHKQALDLIIANKGNPVTDIIREACAEADMNVNDAASSEHFLVFYTRAMDEALPALSDSTASSWGDERTYRFWFSFSDSDNTISAVLELGGWGLTDELKKTHKKIYTFCNARKDDSYRYKRVYRIDKEINVNKIDSAKNTVKEIIKELLSEQAEILCELKK